MVRVVLSFYGRSPLLLRIPAEDEKKKKKKRAAKGEKMVINDGE